MLQMVLKMVLVEEENLQGYQRRGKRRETGMKSPTVELLLGKLQL